MAGIEYDGLDPLLIAQIEDHFARTFNADDVFDLFDDVEGVFAALDPTSFLDDVLDGPDPQASVRAYEQMVTGDWDGDLL
ncbi:hypothetical protein [Streptomyces zaomyceticus]|uniref:hypothetical protein n=1 Tax=Streptomyces zaomyceticus TaxID=68286 RepID=UPI0033B2980C